MKRILLFILLFICANAKLSAQDKIYRFDYDVSLSPHQSQGNIDLEVGNQSYSFATHPPGFDPQTSIVTYTGTTLFTARPSTINASFSGGFRKDLISGLSTCDGSGSTSYSESVVLNSNGMFSRYWDFYCEFYEEYYGYPSSTRVDAGMLTFALQEFEVEPLHVSTESNFVCGAEQITLTLPYYYDFGTGNNTWYVGDAVGGYTAIRTTASGVSSIQVSVHDIPGSSKYNKSYTFKVKKDGESLEVTSPGITFYPAIPIKATITPTDPRCAGEYGSISFSNFLRSDDTSYNVAENNLIVTLENLSGIEVINYTATSDSFTVPNLSSGNWQVSIESYDRNCSEILDTVTILEAPAPISFPKSPAVSNSTCIGQPATVTSTASGGSGSYTYTLKKSSDNSIVGQNSTGTFSIGSGGGYYIEATDSNNCSHGSTGAFTIEIPDAITFTATVKPTTGLGRSDGGIFVTAQGGGGVNEGEVAYEYQLIGVRAWQRENNFTDLPKGTYQVQVRTSENCTSNIEEVTITEPEPITVTIANITAVSCNGYSDGSIMATAHGGTSGYVFALNSNFTDSNEIGKFLNKPAKAYTVFVKDRDGNIASVNTSITQPAKINFTALKTDVTCNGGSDGTVTVTATGGVGGYMYSLDGGKFQSGNKFTGLNTGTYDVTIRDDNGCAITVTNAVTIDEPSAVAVTVAAIVEATCYGSATGAVTLAASGGSGTGYQFALNSGELQPSPSFTGLAAGKYTAIVKDGNGCIATTPFEIGAPNELILTEDVSQRRNITCAGGADGRIVVSSSEGTGVVKYKISSSPVENVDGIFEGLAAGSYTITATDDNGCPATIKVTLAEPAELVFTSTVQHVSCNSGSDGSIAVTPTGGTQPYRYSVNNGATYQTSNIFNGFSAGTYTIRVKDNNGCERSGTVTISQPQGLVLEVISSQIITCYAGNDGQIQVKATGGQAAYTYAIVGVGGANTTGLFANLAAGDYLISAKDANGCEALVDVTLTQPFQALGATFNQQTPSYDGASDGAVTVLGNGGTAPYTYALNGGAYQTGNTFANLSAGRYTVVVKDAKDCLWEQLVILQDPSSLRLTVTVQQDISCSGGNDGVLRATVEGGVGPYLYSINGGAPTSTPVFTNLAAGTYNISASDSRGVTGSGVYNLAEPKKIEISYQLSPVSCYNGADGKVVVSATGGIGELKYSINGVDFQDNNIFDGLKQGSYTIYVQDEKGCTVSSTRTIAQPMPLTVDLQVTNPISCMGGTDGSITVQANGGDGNYKYSIDNGPYQALGTFSGLKAGLYFIKAEDGKGCSVQQQFELANPEELKIMGIQDTVLCKGQSVTFYAGNPGSRYQWVSDKGFSSTQSSVMLDQPGNYKLTVINEAGCAVTKAFKVDVSTTLLKADFLMSSVANAGDTIFVIDVSKPTPARTEWIMPDEAKFVNSNVSGTIKQVVFDTLGTFTIQMTVGLGECADAVHKTITVLPKGQTADVKNALGYKEELIKKFVLYPNPTSGYFSAFINLSEKQKVKLQLIDYSRNNVIEFKNGENEKEYTFEFNHPELAPGVYILSLEVNKEVKTLKVVKL
ncbi:T9SS type A sorting domain-containing protein [Pontibacter kalidii]|uniref:T9SS type A sorting domain-containing protein n=1 Tax=Pontibacter kalidii TaxID=2592049 RepID=UPI00225C2E28|nr:T9SS type A sorting domain-containing protein [Pontibacter kalidii]